MRIIAGEKRGLKLMMPAGDAIRPTTDKVRGAIFNTLQTVLGEAEVFVDLFGGSGAMALEALSRGIPEAWIFDVSKASMAVIKKNIEKAGYTDRVHCGLMSARAAVSYLADRGGTGDLIFMDPPYAEGDASLALIEAIWDKKILKSDGFIMMEHEKSVIMPLCIKGYQRLKEKKYGITVISYYSGE